MTARDFVYWLQGFFELGSDQGLPLTPRQVGLIRRHLALVFIHEIDPAAGPPAQQEKLDQTHQGSGGSGPRPSMAAGFPLYRC
jgi:hypothetical protein